MTIAVSPQALPALVLNADYRPLSYYPLSLWSWQDAIKAVFLDRVNIIAEYEHAVSSPSFSMKLPSVVCLKNYVQPSRHPAFTRFNVFLRDRFECQYCSDKSDLTFDHVDAAGPWRPDDLGKCRRRLFDLQPAKGQQAAAPGQHVSATRSPTGRPYRTCTTTGGCFRPTICMKAGSTISTGTANCSPDRQLRLFQRAAQRNGSEHQAGYDIPAGK